MPWYNGRLYVSAQEIAGGAVPVESELNENSRYPIANQAVAKEIVKTNKTIEDTALGLGKLEKKTVKAEELIAKPLNLLDPSTVQVGYAVSNATGFLYVSDNEVTFDYTAVESGKDYALTYLKSKGRGPNKTNFKYAFYDKNKVFIEGGEWNENTNPIEYITAPPGAAFVRCSCHKTQNKEQMFEAVTVVDGVPTYADHYEPYGEWGNEAVKTFKAELLKAAAAQTGNNVVCDIAEDDTADQISRILSVASGSVLFPKGKTFTLDNAITVSGLSNVTIDLNGCVFTKNGTAGGALFYVDNCDNVVIKNGVFDCNARSEGVGRRYGLSSQNSVVSVKNCIFKHSNYHHIWVRNGYCEGENLDFVDIYGRDDASDVFTDAEDGKRVETHWRNIHSTRQEMTPQVFYFGVYSDTQDCYHTIDGLWAKNCVQTVDLRGGEGYFRNIYADGVCSLITQHVEKDAQGNTHTTDANAPIVTFENVHYVNANPQNMVAPIFIWAGRRVRVKNVLIEAPNWAPPHGIGRAIEVNAVHYPVRDVVIEDVKYSGANLWSGVSVMGDVQCELKNITVDAECEYGISFVDEATKEVTDETTGKTTEEIITKAVINNYDCESKSVNTVNASGQVSANPKHIRLKNTHPTIGTTAERPAMFPCETGIYYDTDLGKMVYWNGTAWVDV